MFIEVHKIPHDKWTEPAEDSAIPKNRKLINVSHITDIDYSHHCEGRAEIEYDGGRITVVGTYDEIVDRIGIAISTGQIQRI